MNLKEWVEIIEVDKENIVIGGIFRNQRSKDEELKHLRKTLNIKKKRKKTTICGDLDFNLVTFEKKQAN